MIIFFVLGGSRQDHRQDFVDASCRSESTTGYPSGLGEPLTSSIGATEIHV
jgi:hypothetical protein